MSSPITRREAITRGGVALAGATLAGAKSAVAQPTTTMSKRLEEKVAFVTGAARGIGRATAVRLAQEGADVALLDIADSDAFGSADGYRLASREDLSAAAEAVREEGHRTIEIVADVRDLAAMREAAKRTADELGSLDIAAAIAYLGGKDARYVSGPVMDVAAGGNARYTAQSGVCVSRGHNKAMHADRGPVRAGCRYAALNIHHFG